jgi:hypothetical protein
MATTDVPGGSISDILANIQKLQTTEQALITQLDTLTSTPGYDGNAAAKLVTQINSIADARLAMFNTISANADLVQSSVAESRVDLVSQMTLYGVIEDQLNKAKAQLDTLSNRNDTKLRMVQINTYYGQRYEAQSNLMKLLIICCLPILIIFILKKKGIIPETISNYLLGIIVAVSAIVLIRKIWDIYARSNMDFNEYNWDYEFADPATQVPSIWQYNKENLFNFNSLFTNLMENLGICVGEACCPAPLTYDSAKKQCVAPMSASAANTLSSQAAAAKIAANPVVSGFVGGRGAGSVSQGFTSGNGLKGTVVATYFNDGKNTVNGITPFSYENNYAAI